MQHQSHQFWIQISVPYHNAGLFNHFELVYLIISTKRLTGYKATKFLPLYLRIAQLTVPLFRSWCWRATRKAWAWLTFLFVNCMIWYHNPAVLKKLFYQWIFFQFFRIQLMSDTDTVQPTMNQKCFSHQNLSVSNYKQKNTFFSSANNGNDKLCFTFE